MNFGIIYLFVFPNNKVYVGKTTFNSFLARMANHSYYAKADDRNVKLYNGWKKHGTPELHVIYTSDEKDILAWEAYFVALFDSFNNGYNSSPGGDAPALTSEESRAKHKASMNTPEIRAARSITSKNFHSKPEVKAALVERNKQMHNDPKYKTAHSEMMRKMHAERPELAKAASERMTKMNAGQSERWKALHADPDYKAAHSERMKKAWAKRKAMLRSSIN